MGARVADKHSSSSRSRRAVFGVVGAVAVLLAGDAGAAATRSPVVAQSSPDVDVAEHTPLGAAGSVRPSVSGDGRFVVFAGPAPEATDQRTTVFLTDRSTAETVELSQVPPDLRRGDTVFPVLSGDGCSVAVVTQLQLDVFRDDDQGDRWDVYRARLPHCGGTPGNWELVSTRMTDAGGVSRDDVLVAPASMSRSGATVAYAHAATHLFDAAGVST
ncbi:MAG: hypothetical protein AB8G26_11850, partial [Ilumatobacter sp.]